jgi:DNA primase
MGKFNRDLLPSGVEYFERYGIPLKGTGAWRDAICPFHSDTKPSLRVRADNGAYSCMVCPAKGDLLKFHMDRTGQQFKEAAKELGAWNESL